MKWKYKDNTKWHRHFAWHPVEVDGDNYWLCFIWRKWRIGMVYGGFWEYSIEKPKDK